MRKMESEEFTKTEIIDLYKFFYQEEKKEEKQIKNISLIGLGIFNIVGFTNMSILLKTFNINRPIVFKDLLLLLYLISLIFAFYYCMKIWKGSTYKEIPLMDKLNKYFAKEKPKYRIQTMFYKNLETYQKNNRENATNLRKMVFSLIIMFIIHVIQLLV